MKITCNVIKDLLPLYIDNLTSEDSNNIIEAHTKECKKCSELMSTLKTEIEVPKFNMQLPSNSYKKLFKKIRNKIITFTSIALVIGILAGIFGGAVKNRMLSQSSANNFFQNLIQENYEQAFRYVYYYDAASDLPPQISYSKAKSIWIDRVKALKDKGTYVKEYTNLRLRSDDTYPIGTVTLTIVEQGQEKTIQMNVWFGPTYRRWKVGCIYENSEPITELEKAMSGFIQDK
jgi:hypothetical protein